MGSASTEAFCIARQLGTGLTDPGRYLALWGGFDTGKTYAACLAATQMAVCFPGSVTVLFRDTYPQLLDTTLVTLERKLWQDLGFVEGQDYRHRPGDKYRYYIIRPNSERPSYIYYRSMPDAGVGIDKLIASQKSFEPDRIIIEESALLDQRFLLGGESAYRPRGQEHTGVGEEVPDTREPADSRLLDVRYFRQEDFSVRPERGR